jgi:hypothetical protein
MARIGTNRTGAVSRAVDTNHATDSRKAHAVDHDATAGRIAELSDELQAVLYELDGIVGAAREGGVPWATIGEAFGGITKQGASQRFRSVVGDTGAWSRLTDAERARFRRRAGVKLLPCTFRVSSLVNGEWLDGDRVHKSLAPAVREAHATLARCIDGEDVEVVKVEPNGRRRRLGLPPMPKATNGNGGADRGFDF